MSVVTWYFRRRKLLGIACGLKIAGLRIPRLRPVFTPRLPHDPASFYAPSDEYRSPEEDNNRE